VTELDSLSTAPARWLAWDTEFFGRRIARAEPDRLAPETAGALLDWCRVNQIECLYLLAEAGDATTIQVAEAHGFSLVDMRLTLATPIGQMAAGEPAKGGYRVGAAQSSDVEALAALARISHTDSRFFFDSRFEPDKAAELYAVWIKKSCQNPTGAVLVAREEAGPIGYLALDRTGTNSGQIALVAVAPGNQGRGVGQALLAEGRRWFMEQGLEQIRVVTQGRNVRALRFYERAGFQTEAVQLWYHRWFPAKAGANQVQDERVKGQ
jgi:dTDP-4-amino-4,6-dideoxy-D-galactose acyltransferase